MASRKPSARSKRVQEFKQQLGDDEHMFAAAQHHRKKTAARKEAALRDKSCESKNRYSSKSEAQAAIADCERFGTRGLHSYRCPYCNGWHLTSKPKR